MLAAVLVVVVGLGEAKKVVGIAEQQGSVCSGCSGTAGDVDGKQTVSDHVPSGAIEGVGTDRWSDENTHSGDDIECQHRACFFHITSCYDAECSFLESNRLTRKLQT